MSLINTFLKNPIVLVMYLPVYFMKDCLINKKVRLIIKKLNNFKLFDIDYLKSRRKSERVYIIGSSDGLNELNVEDWQLINSNDSIALNYSFLHPHVPKIMLMQLPFIDKNDLLKAIAGIEKKIELNPNIVLLLRSAVENLNSDDIKFLKESKCIFGLPRYEAYIPYRNAVNFNLILRLNKILMKPPLIHTRGGAVVSAIYLAYAMGYK